MTEPMERSLTDQSDKKQDVGCTPKSVPLMNTADEVALSDKEAVKRLPYAAVFLLRVGVTAAALWVLLTFVIGVYVCHSNEAYPMVKDGDLCLTLRPAELKAGDAVVYRSEGKTRFGRVVALSGDKVEISGEELLVNGENLMIPAVYPTDDEGSSITYPYRVPDECVFILNAINEHGKKVHKK